MCRLADWSNTDTADVRPQPGAHIVTKPEYSPPRPRGITSVHLTMYNPSSHLEFKFGN